MLRVQRQGQSTVEYAVLIIVIMAALIVGGTYVKRGIQGRWKSSVDDLGDQYDTTNMYTNIRYTLEQNSESRIRSTPWPGGYWSNRYDTSTSVERQEGQATIKGY